MNDAKNKTTNVASVVHGVLTNSSNDNDNNKINIIDILTGGVMGNRVQFTSGQT